MREARLPAGRDLVLPALHSPIRVLVELDILNAYERVRAYYLNIAETLAGGK